nr:nucleoside triphosphate pyrophosphohydrolase [Zophobihabitans entericus]
MPQNNCLALKKLLEITNTLRDPVNGCEWDRVQTFESITPHTLEETYEVLDAIERKDYPELKEELGDLLFQVVFYADLAKEQGYFTFDDVCQAVNDKLIRRHPHIFQNESVSMSDAKNWEQRKQQERSQKQQFSVLDDIPLALPALMRAHKIQKRCASVGFDWHELEPVVDKVQEEILEVMFEVKQETVDQEKLAEEVGDLLFATVNLSRHLGQNAELALKHANQKFERRFRQVEGHFKQRGQDMNQASLDEMEEVWQQVKQAEHK